MTFNGRKMKTKSIINLIATVTFLSTGVMAHEGHGIPGAMPPAPHGGVVQEASHLGADVHQGKEEAELFFEAVYDQKALKIYPLALKPGNTNLFVSLSPQSDLTSVVVKVEFPRSKKTELLKVDVQKEFILAEFDSKRANRFFVHVSATHEKESKAGKIQIENK